MQTTVSEVEDFLYREADLLDSRDYVGWLALFTADAIYWIPAVADEIDPSRQVSIVHDDAQFLAERVWRLDSGQAFAQEPLSRTAHLVTNIRVAGEEPGTDGTELDVRATFMVTEHRRGALHHHSGRYRYRLRRTDAGLRIAHKKVELVNNGAALGNLSLLL